jgi:hypothetical protein
MRVRIFAHFILVSLSAATFFCAYGLAEPLPKEAQVLVDQHESDIKRLKASYEAEVRASDDKFIRKLKMVRDAYTKPGTLKQAIAIQDQIKQRRLQAYAIETAPYSLLDVKKGPGESQLYNLTGSSRGQVWGTDVYTDDSDLSTVAVHAGVLKDGESGVVKVTLLEGKPDYEGSVRNGIATESYGPYSRSFKIEPYKLDIDDD